MEKVKKLAKKGFHVCATIKVILFLVVLGGLSVFASLVSCEGLLFTAPLNKLLLKRTLQPTHQ